MAIPEHPRSAAQVRRQIDTHYPTAICDDCLAALLIASVDEVHAAAITVAHVEGFSRRMRTMHGAR